MATYTSSDPLDGLLSIDIGGYTLLGKYSVDFGAVIGRQFPVARSDILLQLFLVAHANQRHRNGPISQNPRNGELGDRFLIASSLLFQPSSDPQFFSERIPFKKRQTKRIAFAAPIPIDKSCLFGKSPGEQTEAERSIGHEANPGGLAVGQHFPLHAPVI